MFEAVEISGDVACWLRFVGWFQIGAGLYAVGRPVLKRNDEDGQIGTIQSLPLERGALFNSLLSPHQPSDISSHSLSSSPSSSVRRQLSHTIMLPHWLLDINSHTLFRLLIGCQAPTLTLSFICSSADRCQLSLPLPFCQWTSFVPSGRKIWAIGSVVITLKVYPKNPPQTGATPIPYHKKNTVSVISVVDCYRYASWAKHTETTVNHHTCLHSQCI